MPVPRYDIPKYKPSEAKVKSNYIVRMLFRAGYNIEGERDAICIIEKYGVDKFDFDYPYGSFEEYKKHVLAGEFDVELKFATKEDHEKLLQDVKEGKAWVTY